MNLKGLIHRELKEGMTESELAAAVQVPLRTLTNIHAGKEPKTLPSGNNLRFIFGWM